MHLRVKLSLVQATIIPFSKEILRFEHSTTDKSTVSRDLVSDTSAASFKGILSPAIPAHTPKHNIGKICSLYQHNNEKTIWIISSFLFTLVAIVRIRFRFFPTSLSFGGIEKDQSGRVVINFKRSWFRWELHKILISLSAWNSNSNVIYCIFRRLLQTTWTECIQILRRILCLLALSLWTLPPVVYSKALRSKEVKYRIYHYCASPPALASLSPVCPFTQHHPGRLKNQFTEHEENKANIKSSSFKFGLLLPRFRSYGKYSLFFDIFTLSSVALFHFLLPSPPDTAAAQI